MKAELRAVSLGLVAVVNDPVEQSGVSVVLEQHLNSLPAKDLNLVEFQMNDFFKVSEYSYSKGGAIHVADKPMLLL